MTARLRDQSPAQIRDGENARRNLAAARHIKTRADFRAWMAGEREILKGVL